MQKFYFKLQVYVKFHFNYSPVYSTINLTGFSKNLKVLTFKINFQADIFPF